MSTQLFVFQLANVTAAVNALEDSVTIQEAQIARIAFHLGRFSGHTEETSKEARELIEAFITSYQPQKPCQYQPECLKTGRCPKEIVCNN